MTTPYLPLLYTLGNIARSMPVVSLIMIALIGMVLFALAGQLINVLIQAKLSGVEMSMSDLIRMKFRKVDPRTIVHSLIKVNKAGLRVSQQQLEAHYQSGGRLVSVINALSAAKQAKIALTWDTACAIDLAGRDIEECVRSSITPRTIPIPSVHSGRPYLRAVAQDGIELQFQLLLHVNTYLPRVIGGTTEELLVARTGAAAIQYIGDLPGHQALLQNPHALIKALSTQSLDENSAFLLLKIEITHLSKGRDVGKLLREGKSIEEIQAT